MNWAKIDAGLHRNPKVRMAGRDARDVYLFLVLTNAEQNADGELPAMYADPEYLADTLQCSIDEARNGLKRCVTFQLLHVTDEIIRLIGWDDSWRVKTSSDRVAKHRRKKKAAEKVPPEKKQGVTKDETPCNVTPVTGNKCNALEESRGDKSRGEYTPQSPPGGPVADSRILSEANEILVKLNSDAGQNFQPMSKSDMAPIVKALTASEDEPSVPVAELALVIEHRCALWLGTEQEQYLRPSTLFGPKHLSGYRSAARKWDEAGRPSTGGKDSGVRKVADWSNVGTDPLETAPDMENTAPIPGAF